MAGSKDPTSAAAAVSARLGSGMRGAAERLRATPAELAALAVLLAGSLAALGMLWLLSRPTPVTQTPSGSDGGGSGAGAPAGPATSPSTGASGGPAIAGGEVVVHVAGEVAEPGLYRLEGPVRVADAVDAAGGTTSAAVLGALNLARRVSDGEQLFVPGPESAGGAPGPAASAGSSGAGSGGDGAAAATRPDGTLDLNLATAAELEALPGVGPVIAERIVAYRERSGGFAEAGELRQVSGIGEKTFQSLAPRVSA